MMNARWYILRVKTKWVNIRLTEEDFNSVKRYAKDNGITMTEMFISGLENTYPLTIYRGRIDRMKEVIREYEQKQKKLQINSADVTE